MWRVDSEDAMEYCLVAIAGMIADGISESNHELVHDVVKLVPCGIGQEELAEEMEMEVLHGLRATLISS